MGVELSALLLLKQNVMKEVRFIFSTVAILGFIASVITFFVSIGADITIAPQLLAFAGVMFFIGFASGLVGLLADD